MIHHSALSDGKFAGRRKVFWLIEQGEIGFAGNSKLKIYGTLNCSSGKRMKIRNRVFFKDQDEAIDQGYRPCGHCMHQQYNEWKKYCKIDSIGLKR